MKRRAAGAAFLGFWLAVSSQSAIGAALPPETPPTRPADLNPVVQDSCVTCHNDVTLSGNLSL